MKVEIYSDVACPWCYIGDERFERALSSFAGSDEVEVVYRPYQLDPNAPTEPIPMMEYLEGRFGPGATSMADRVADAARADGLTIDYATGLAANTLDAHRLMWLAEREHGPEKQRHLARRLFEAHFAEGADVGDNETLATLAGEAGMDVERVRAFLASREGFDEVRAAIADAQRLGITAVPTFVFEGRYAVQGAQPPSSFVEALQTVERETTGGASNRKAVYPRL